MPEFVGLGVLNMFNVYPFVDGVNGDWSFSSWYFTVVG